MRILTELQKEVLRKYQDETNLITLSYFKDNTDYKTLNKALEVKKQLEDINDYETLEQDAERYLNDYYLNKKGAK